MFGKVLIAEDHEIANISVQKTLGELGVVAAKYVYYCDDALAWIRNALRDQAPYELLITDLIFEQDHHKQQLEDGFALIRAAKAAQPDLKVIVFSAESRPGMIDDLFNSLGIDGYVRKARRDAQHLKEAFQAVHNGSKYRAPGTKQADPERNSYEFTTFDITILSLLSRGVLQKDIPYYLQQKSISPSGLSSVEKRISFMKEVLEFSKNEQLIAYCKDIGVI